MEDDGFFATRFDFSFSRSITPSSITVFHGIGLAVIALSAVVITIWSEYTIWGALFALFGAIAAAMPGTPSRGQSS